MTTASRELFELCKQVYEATGWGETDSMFYQQVDRSRGKPYSYHWLVTGSYAAKGASNKDRQPIPLYNSDYLLEKLKPFLNAERKSLSFRFTDNVFWLDADDIYNGPRLSAIQADTPLKAILKLVVALDDTGVKL